MHVANKNIFPHEFCQLAGTGELALRKCHQIPECKDEMKSDCREVNAHFVLGPFRNEYALMRRAEKERRLRARDDGWHEGKIVNRFGVV